MSNVIQFPGPKGQPGAQSNDQQPAEKPKKSQNKKKITKAVTAGTVLSIMLATTAVNNFVFNVQSTDMSSVGSRSIASVGSRVQRDSKWEKSIAEKLASAEVRSPASFNIGREVTVREKLHFGALRGVYSLEFAPGGQILNKIYLQENGSDPTYLSAQDFFKSFGELVDQNFKQAELVGNPSRSEDRIFETYKILDSDNRPVREAHFEMDRHGRLLSLQMTSLH